MKPGCAHLHLHLHFGASAGASVVPLRKGANRDRLEQQAARLRRAQAMRPQALTSSFEQPVGGGWADTQQQPSRLGIQPELAVAFQRRNELSQHRHQARATDAVGRPPHLLQGCPHPTTVPGLAGAPLAGPAFGRMVQQLDGILAVIPRDRHQLVQNALLRTPVAQCVARPQLGQQFALACLTHHASPSPSARKTPNAG